MQKKEPREQILKAAKARFGHYGFNKTTMVEIAKDCDMSAANIYRHFDGKKDIIAVLATQLFNFHESKLAEIAAQKSTSCSVKFHAFFLQALLMTHQYATEQAKMKEMVDFISQKRFDLIQSNSDAIEKLIKTILQEGVDNGEFRIGDIANTAKTFRQATVMFHTPLFMEMHSLRDLKLYCKNILDLLITAITPKERN